MNKIYSYTEESYVYTHGLAMWSHIHEMQNEGYKIIYKIGFHVTYGRIQRNEKKT